MPSIVVLSTIEHFCFFDNWFQNRLSRIIIGQFIIRRRPVVIMILMVEWFWCGFGCCGSCSGSCRFFYCIHCCTVNCGRRVVLIHMDLWLWLLFRCLKDGDDWCLRDFDVMVVAAILVEVPVVEDFWSIVMVIVVGLHSMCEKKLWRFHGKNFIWWKKRPKNTDHTLINITYAI